VGVKRTFFPVTLILFQSACFHAQAGLTVQVGAFSNQEDAADFKSRIEGQGFQPVIVRPEENAEKGLLYKTLVGNFETRAAAEAAKNALEASGTVGFIRNLNSRNVADIRAAITAATQTVSYFSDPENGQAVSSEESSATLNIKAMREQVLADESTSSEKIKAWRQHVSLLSDADPAKGGELVRLGYLAGANASIYRGGSDDYVSIQPLLAEVANGKISANDYDRLAARAQVAHYLHYYLHDYQRALSAYRQVLRDALDIKDYRAAANARMEIAAASFEFAKATGIDFGDLQAAVSALWNDAVQMQKQFLSDNSLTGKTVRQSTCRIGLMLSEILMAQRNWSDARSVAESVISIYQDQDELGGERAEAWCHLGRIGLELRDKPLCYRAVDNAIALGEKANKIWGDERRDPLWKAWALKNAASYYFDEPVEVRLQIKEQMMQRFKGNPGLKKYFGEDTE